MLRLPLAPALLAPALLAFAPATLAAAPPTHPATACAGLRSLALPDTTLTSATLISPGTPLQLPSTQLPASVTANLPAFCRVTGILHPTPDSVIRFEVWMPEQKWNSRILDVGNGGFAGSIGYRQMAANLEHGYATAGSDAGHQAEAEDASWAYHHPEKIKDFGYRAVHLTALRSKDIVQAFYGHPQTKAYFDSCSDGGREALMEAQRFPADYDGILAGAPANNWAHMVTGGLAGIQALTRDPASYISSMKLPAINRASLAACDAPAGSRDSLHDGIVSDPQACRFDPAVLLCQGLDDVSCLTAPQVAALRSIYAGGKDAHGRPIFPGLLPGDENPIWHDWLLGNAPGGSNYVNGYFRYMVVGDPTWQPLTADSAQALQLAMERVAPDVDATNPNLGPFIARGGKLILYHGWNDPAISPWNTIDYYNQVQNTLGPDRTQSAIRLYMVPGMEHCVNGPGPSHFGQLGLPGAGGDGSGAPGEGSGVMDKLQTWVETGQAPTTLLATKPADPHTSSPAITRPLCPYPQKAVFGNHGNPNLPESFACTTR